MRLLTRRSIGNTVEYEDNTGEFLAIHTTQTLRTLTGLHVERHLHTQQLCFRFRLPKQHSESVALLMLLHNMKSARPPLTVTDAALILEMPLATCARKFKELVNENFVELIRYNADKRRVHPSLTVRGTQFVMKYLQILQTESSGANAKLA